MKKLFLTSGIIACMACPAFATGPSGFPAPTTPGTNGEACVNDVIGTYANSTTLVANWVENFGVMALNENEAGATPTANDGGAASLTYDTTTPSNSHLWLTPYNSSSKEGTGVYKREDNQAGGYTFTALAAGDQAISVPAGITVTYNRTDTLPSGASTNVTASTSETLERTFLGYYANGTTNAQAMDDTTGTLKLIGSDGKLTPAGVTAGATYDNDTPWVAHYALRSPRVGDPSAYGYHFNGWHVDGATSVTTTANLPGNLYKDSSLVADWSPVTYAVSYNCGAGTGTPDSNAMTTATFDQSFTWASNNDSTTGTQNCHKDGYHFTGWTCVANLAAGGTTNLITNGGTSYVDDDNAATTADQNPASYNGVAAAGTDGKWQYANLAASGATGTTVSCTAQYALNRITISWTDPVGGNSTTTNACTYEGAVTVPANPSRTGYVFNGWTVQQAQSAEPEEPGTGE